MARRGRGVYSRRKPRKYRRYMRGPINHVLDVGFLAGQDAISEVLSDTLEEKAYLTSIVATWSINQVTRVGNDGPIVVGVAHSDYTAAEIEEWLEIANGWSQGDEISREQMRRKIRMVGTFTTPDDASDTRVLNDGKPIRTKCGWQLITGQTLQVWAWNSGQSAMETTEPDVTIVGHANLWPN